MKHKTYPTQEKKEENNIIYHKSTYEATMEQKPYIVPATKAATYSKLDKAKKKEDAKIKKMMKEYTKR